MRQIAVLISNAGTGTNLQAIIDGIASGEIKGKIVVVISDSEDAYGLVRAKKHNIPTLVIKKGSFGKLGTSLEKLLKEKYRVDFVCLAGWKQIIPDSMIDIFKNEILNVHPGLIPDTLDGVVKNPDGTKGLWNRGKFTNAAIQNFLDQKATYAGSTIHFLSHEFDFGPVLGRCFEKILPGDTVESLYTRLKKKENKLYVDVLAKLCERKTFISETVVSRLKIMNGEKKILITDGGGRGTALVDKYGQSKHVGKILVVPGNDLMQINIKKKVVTFPNLKTTSVDEILEICQKEKVDLVDVAQDNAVEIGLVDELKRIGIPVVGPTRLAGQIEWDKAWARMFMAKYQITCPQFNTFTNRSDAIEYLKRQPNKKWFVKASGLAEGKGALSAPNNKEAIERVLEMERFGNAGSTFLMEEWLEGEEFSAFALCDGENFKVVGYAQDHKRVNDGDTGPNTGGMGCVSNPRIVDARIKKQVEEIFKKTVNGLKLEGRPYKGVLYLGGMVVNGKVACLEFNARWGDPEAQVIIPAIKNDFVEVADAIIFGKIKNLKLDIDKKVRVVVAATAKGYPLDYLKVKGKKITGIEKAQNMGVKIYGAGIKKVGKDYVVNGGRVLYLMGEGKDVIEARDKVYKAMAQISIEGDNLHYRTDIGWRDVERMRNSEPSRRIERIRSKVGKHV